MELFTELLPSLNLKTKHLIDENPYAEKEYNAYMVNRTYSFGLDTLLYANEMNANHFLDKRLQYDFYFYGLSKSKRFNKWIKPEALNNIEIVKEYYKCSDKKAKEYANVLTDEQIKTIEKRLFKGG